MRIWIAALAVAVALPAAGTIYQAWSVRSESRRFPPPGRLVDVGGRRLHLICFGQGEPTVIFEASGFGGALSSSGAREELSAYTRVCSYDRMGMGWSDPGPPVISAGQLADDLKRLTIEGGLHPPFILVPASLGGVTVELFARRNPEWVAGLVFVDAGNSLVLERVARHLNAIEVEAACLVKMAARTGALRLLDPFGLRGEVSPAAARLYRVEPAATICGVARGLRISARELAAAPPLAASIPLMVLVHERPDGLLPPPLRRFQQAAEPGWLDAQREFSRRSARPAYRVVPGSDHLIGNSRPHDVAAAVLELLVAVRGVR